jgi:8-oxo-dGTP pyrophosphatase MutT (NUDIX family)
VSRLHADALEVLTGWAAPDAAQERLRAAYVGHLLTHDDGVWRSCRPAHLTLHRKGGFWGQFGGHCEPGDPSLRAAALREGAEESGIAGLRLLGDGPVDLDRHALSSAFGGCGEHLDVRYAALAPPGAEPVVSDESHDVAWFPCHELPQGAVDDIGRLVERAGAVVSAPTRRG